MPSKASRVAGLMTAAGSGVETFTGVERFDPGDGGDVDVVVALTAVVGVAGPTACPQNPLDDDDAWLEVGTAGTGCSVV